MQIPTLETPRLRLRPQSWEDWPEYRNMMASGRSTYMGGPFSEKYAWGMFCNDLAQWALFGHGSLMLENREDGRCLGQVGVNHGPLFPEPELGWMLYPGAEGHGSAHEAAVALREWAFQVRRLSTLVSYIDPGNMRSRRLAERLGAELDPDAVKQDPDDLVYRHAAPRTAGN
ncbi:GNAT family N-acetyltransferase [Nisaea sp.]|uniref:GNAT family N-acetyltransferase n=1 Tax=Nisaea sp. TaxID=2024842 RepID=UPI003B5262DD